MTGQTKPVVLVIMDGYGCNPRSDGNAISSARKPVLSRLWETYLHTELAASGLAVGLPPGQMGNSEVGHLNLGAGKVVFQDFTKITQAIADGSFFTNPDLLAAMDHVKGNRSSLHLLGLVGTGGVHAHESHLFATMELARRSGIERVCIHAFTDGRDSMPRDGLGAIQRIEHEIQRLGIGRIATVSGRYYAMDRDRRWDRTALAYAALVRGEGRKAESAEAAVRDSYGEGITDEFILPTVVGASGNMPTGVIADHDAVIFFNFRTDRPRQLVRAFTAPQFHDFERGPRVSDLCFVTMTEYDKELPVRVAFRTEDVPMPLARVIADRGMKQLHAAETEKYAHVTFFFNGGREVPFSGEDRLLVPSPREVGTYDHKPEMSAPEIADRTAEAIATGRYDFVLVNFANADMVGHTGVLQAAVSAVETVDRCVGQIVEAVMSIHGTVIITADHGNAEQMVDYETGGPFTSHTTEFPVPFLLVSEVHGTASGTRLRDHGVLADVAPTVLDLMDIAQPMEMDGSTLLITEET